MTEPEAIKTNDFLLWFMVGKSLEIGFKINPDYKLDKKTYDGLKRNAQKELKKTWKKLDGLNITKEMKSK